MSAPTLTKPGLSQKPMPTGSPMSFDDFRIPTVDVGDKVYWYESPAMKVPAIAFITKVYDQCVDLAVLVPGASNVWPKETSLWRRDPRPWRAETAEGGCWEFIPKESNVGVTATLQKLEEELVALRLRVAALEMPTPPKSK